MVKKVITYGTFDLFHEGHYRLLKRAKELGDYLIVGVTTDSYDESRGKLNVQQGLMERIENVKASGLADNIIIEEYEGQKINDILKHNIDIFVIGSDWVGKFDYLREYCEVVYLERTKGISSTQLRALNNRLVKIGIVECSSTAGKFIKESRYVSGVNVEGVFGHNRDSLEQFVIEHELAFFSLDYDEFLNKVDAVYIASPHQYHYSYIKNSLERRRHVLCESPMVLSSRESVELYTLAKSNACTLLEAIKIAFIPGFIRLMNTARSGMIGKIKNIDVTLTKCTSIIEAASCPLFAIIKLLGTNIEEYMYYTCYDSEKQADVFTKINLKYKDAIATVKVGSGVISEDDLIISGTKGYIYVPAEWWRAECFEIRFNNYEDNKKHCFKFEGDGLRYELAEFISMINRCESQTYKLTPLESISIINIIGQFIAGKDIRNI